MTPVQLHMLDTPTVISQPESGSTHPCSPTPTKRKINNHGVMDHNRYHRQRLHANAVADWQNIPERYQTTLQRIHGTLAPLYPQKEITHDTVMDSVPLVPVYNICNISRKSTDESDSVTVHKPLEVDKYCPSPGQPMLSNSAPCVFYMGNSSVVSPDQLSLTNSTESIPLYNI